MNFLQRLCFIFPDLILLGSIILHLYLCPFTKVEESFNMQAGYDLQHLNFLSELKDFDHLEFSGVVPRTFLGALVMTLMSYPVQILNETFLPLVGNVPFLPSSVYRLSLGVMVWLSFCYFRRGIHISNKFSSRTGAIFSVLLAMQFHIPYYASRTLPNTFALAIVMVAYGLWFRNKPIKCLYCIGVATVLFRCDMLVLLAPMAMQMLVFEQVPLVSTFFSGVAVCVLTLILSVLVDSYFWMRLLWPEGEVLFFNTVENRSSEWGTFPFHWYFTSALPKALHTSLPLVVVGLLNPCQNTRNERSSIWYYLWPTLSFLVLYSFLPHKELRFVFPAIPMFTLAAARGLDSMLPAALFGRYTGTTSNKSEPVGVFRGVCSTVLLIGIISLAVSVTSVFSVASQHNYPGGQALTKLNEHILSSSREFCITDSFSPPSPLQECAMRPDMDCLPIVRIHIDAAAAMSGINR
jgi:alpha-1,6-mannosyltransferase